VITPADVPSHRAKPGRLLTALCIGMAGLFIGLLAAALRHKLHQRVRAASTPRPAERTLEAVIADGPELTVSPARMSSSEPVADSQLPATITETAGPQTEILQAPIPELASPETEGPHAPIAETASPQTESPQAPIPEPASPQTESPQEPIPGPASIQTESFQAASPHDPISEPATPQTTTQEWCAIVDPSRMLSSGSASSVERSVSEMSTPARPAFEAPEVAAADTAAETAISTDLINTAPASSSEQMSQPEPSSLNLSEPTSPVTAPGPIAPQPEPEPFNISDYEHKVEASPGPTEEIGGPGPVEQNDPSPEPAIESSYAPTTSMTDADPVAQQPEPESFDISNYEHKVDASASPTELIAALEPVEPNDPSPEPPIELSDAPSTTAPIDEIAAPEPLEQNDPWPEPPIEPSAAPSTTAPVAHQWLSAPREVLQITAQPEPSRASEPQTVPVAPNPAEKLVPQEDPDTPWWLSYLPRQHAEQSTPLLWQGEKTGKSWKERLHPGRDPVRFPLHTDPSRSATPSRDADPSRNANPSAPKPASAPPQMPLNERRPDPKVHPASLSPQAPAQPAKPDSSPGHPTSRLSGLRSLLTGFGPKDAHSSAPTVHPERAQVTLLDRATGTREESSPGEQGSAKSPAPLPQPTGVQPRAASSQPQLLKPAAPRTWHEVEEAPSGETSPARTVKPGSELDSPTLPSKRGQYGHL